MEANQVARAFLKRQRSLSPGEEVERAVKVFKKTEAPDAPSLKRQRSSSVDTLVGERDVKILKYSDNVNDDDDDEDDDDNQHDYGSGYGSDTDVEPEFDQPPPYMEIDHVKITNLKLVSIDEQGNEIIIPRPLAEMGLPIPDPSPPLSTAKTTDPLDDIIITTQDNDKKLRPLLASQQSNAAHASPANFAWVGDMKLFGLIPAQLYIYHHISDELHPYTEVVRVAKAEQISLATFIPSLKGSDWDLISLEGVTLGWQHRRSSSRFGLVREKGMYMETDLVFQGALQPVSDFMRDFFKQGHPSLHVTAWLGSTRTYDKIDQPASLVLTGTLEHVSVNVLDILEFREIGVELVADQTYDMHERRMKWHFEFGFTGRVNLKVPGTAVPLQVEYCLRKALSSWQLALRLRDDEWTDVFGVKGLKLSEVSLQAQLSSEKPGLSNLSFEVGAALEIRKTKVAVHGYYSQDNYSIEAYLGDLNLQQLGTVFYELVGFDLDIFHHDVTFNSMILRVSNRGLELRGQVTINGHASAEGCLALSKDGISISGLIGDVEFEELLVKEAGFDVFIASKMDTHCARTSMFSIRGDVSFSGVDVKVGIYMEKSEKDGLYWTVYGEVQGSVSTSHMVPELKETFLDISLRRLALIASNHYAPSASYPGLQYPALKGIQFCAIIDSIPELENLMRGSVNGMVLRAMHVSGGKFALSIILPAERTMKISDSVYTGPLEIEVQAGDDIQLLLKAVLNIEVDTQPEPLQLSMGLKANKTAASAYAQMLNDWANPCNLGEKVIIRKCAVEFGIIYTTFFATGTAGVVGLAGELAIGSKMAGVAMKVSQNPGDQLLSAQIQDLSIVDLVEFASLVADTEFPKPDNFIHFNNAELYLSTGTSVGETAYPAGVSLKGDMEVFGKHAQFDCTIGSELKIMAAIESFVIGSLVVKGATQADPIVNIELSKNIQQVLIDGAVEIWGVSAALHLEAAMYPKPVLNFNVEFRLSDLFLLHLEAKLKGDMVVKDIKSWANADFELYALVEQQLIDYITSQLEQQINAAQEAVKHSFDDIKREMEQKEAAFKAHCQAAIDDLEKAREDWHQKKALIDGKMESARQEAARIRRELQEKVDEAQRSFNSFITDRESDLEHARANAAAAIRDAQHDVDEAQRNSDNAIREAQADLQRLRQEFENGFGSAERDLESARHDVEEAQRRVDSLDNDIRWIDRRIDDEPWYNCPPLIAEKAGLLAAQGAATASLQVVRGIFFAAEAVVHGTGFAAAQGAIGSAEFALEGIRIAKSEALDLTKDTLEEVNSAQQELIQAAVDGLHAAKTASEELHVFDLAKEALSKGESVANGLVDGAQTAMDSLSSCGEFIAFDAAEAALRFAQENTKELNLARYAVEVAEGAVNVGLDIGKWAIQHAGKIFNIRKMEFSGSVRSLVAADENAPPLVVTIEAVVFGEYFEIQIVWKPDFNLVKFIKELFILLWEKITKLAKETI